jgi:hypothetical protein
VSELRQQRLAFATSLVESGSLPVPLTEQQTLWAKRFYKTVQPLLHDNPRLVNSFKIGADPEFVFESESETHAALEPGKIRKKRVDATSIGLRTGLFAGADQNGRLVEVRPAAHRSALHVMASLVDSLRWLGMVYPDTLGLNWLAGAYQYDDGIGGHVHFGRKRPSRVMEVTALDAVTSALYKLKMFPDRQVQARRTGGVDGRGAYGNFSDYRLQMHGYEYRTLPSWLDNPWLAYFVLTVTKLAVINPKLVRPWQGIPPTQFPAQSLRNLLAFYKGVDDDAALCYFVMSERGLPKHVGGDFKSRWGLDYTTLYPVDVTLLPNCIKPSPETVQDVFKHFLTGEALPKRHLSPNWKHIHAPEGFFPMIRDTQPKQIGMGELLWDVVGAEKHPLRVMPSEYNESTLTVTENLHSLLPLGYRQVLEKTYNVTIRQTRNEDNKRPTIYLSRDWRRDAKRLQIIKKVLLSGFFPLWHIESATPDALSQWEKPISGKKTYGTVTVYSEKEQ